MVEGRSRSERMPVRDLLRGSLPFSRRLLGSAVVLDAFSPRLLTLVRGGLLSSSGSARLLRLLSPLRGSSSHPTSRCLEFEPPTSGRVLCFDFELLVLLLRRSDCDDEPTSLRLLDGLPHILSITGLWMMDLKAYGMRLSRCARRRMFMGPS